MASYPQAPRVGQAVRDALQARLDRRKYIYVLNEVIMLRMMAFDRDFLHEIGLHKELKRLLDSECEPLDRCQAQRCQMQSLADTAFKVSYAYVVSVLEMFKTIRDTGVFICSDSADRLDADDTRAGHNSYLLPDELNDLVTIANESIVEILADEHADFPEHSEEDVDELPGIYYTIKKHGYNSLCDLPTAIFSNKQTFARYWANLHRFEMRELRVEHNADTGKSAVKGRSSHWLWYCGRCLSDRVEHYCRVGRRQQRRSGLLRAVVGGIDHG